MESLPSDIWLNIFNRLPLETVAQCKCVSKPWNTLISHHCRPPPSSSPNSTLLVVGSSSSLMNFGPLGVPPEVIVTGKCTKVIGTCHGLICLALEDSNNVVEVCNPVINQGRRFSFQPVQDNYFLAIYSYFGFGFDSVNQDYKIVRVIQSRYETRLEICRIYAGTTRLVVLPPDRVPFQLTDAVPVTATANGSCYWIAVNLRNRNVLEIVRFDMETNEFVEIPFPPPGMPGWELEYSAVGDVAEILHRKELDINGRQFRLGNYRDSVCLFFSKTTEIEIWCMNSIQDSRWSKQFCIRRSDQYHVVLGFSGFENEELVVSRMNNIIYGCDPVKSRLVFPMLTARITQAVPLVHSIVPVHPPAQHLMSQR